MKTRVPYAMVYVAVSCSYFDVLALSAVAASDIKPVHYLLTREKALYNEMRLREKGHDPADLESVKAAVADPKWASARNAAVELLAARMGKDAIPIVKQALDDPTQWVRCSAATLLAVFGDKGGLARMRKDLADSIAKKSAAEADQAMAMDESEKREAKRHRTLRFKDALAAAKVLAEFGDHSGYELAITTVKGDEYPVHRSDAIKILSHISKTDLAVLRAENRDPDAVLLRLAETEQEPFVIGAIQHYADVHLRFDVGTRILETLAKSPHVPENRRKDVETSLERRRWNLERAGQSAPTQQ